jgi:hypothetical protein
MLKMRVRWSELRDTQHNGEGQYHDLNVTRHLLEALGEPAPTMAPFFFVCFEKLKLVGHGNEEIEEL